MLASKPAQELGAWVTGEHPLTVEYSKEALVRIRAAVVDAFMALPHGGLEIGGILLGVRGTSGIRVVDFKRIECEHALSPKFVLSANDEAKLAAQLGELTSGGTELEAVGWFVSHSRTDLELRPRDVELHERYFPGQHQVILVLKPYKWDPTRAAFFMREPDGTMRTDAPHGEFTIEAPAPPAPRETVAGAPVHATEPLKPEAELAGAIVPEAPAGHSMVPVQGSIDPAEAEADPAMALQSRPQPKRRMSIVMAAVAAVAAAAALLAGAAVLTSYYRSTRPYLRVTGTAEQVAIEWDRSGQPLRGVTGAALEIIDGQLPPQAIPLDPSGLEKGTLLYTNSSDQVQVRLKISQGGTTRVEDTATFIRQPRSGATQPVAPQTQAKDRADVQPRAPGQPVRTDGPAAGRAIWTGNLPKDGILLFANGRPSSGTLTGQLPNGPMRVRVYPGELAKGGIVVYAPGDPEYEDFNAKAPDPANGWNQTQLKGNKRRAAALSVLEAPAPQNGWGKMVLRNTERPVSVIFVEWEACRSAEQCPATQRAESRD
ncbi:MAG: hypothetical protein IT168_09200 [Bryobacterales bacterium]|nr:hypothetical protein [Bryobacterales bacterium]